MRKLALILAGISFFVTYSVAQSTDGTDKSSAHIKFSGIVYDYGSIEQNSEGICEFKFTNEGKSPLILSNVRSSCGCTVPNWPRNPLGTGEEATIKVKYNTTRIGSFSKSITVYSNGSEQPIILRIKGKVVNKTS